MLMILRFIKRNGKDMQGIVARMKQHHKCMGCTAWGCATLVCTAWGCTALGCTAYMAGLGSSTVDQVLQMYTKYKYWSSTHFFKRYLSTSSTFTSSTSTSTHIKICFKVMMYIQSRVNFGWTKQNGFPQIMSAQKSRCPYILCRVDFGWTK